MYRNKRLDSLKLNCIENFLKSFCLYLCNSFIILYIIRLNLITFYFVNYLLFNFSFQIKFLGVLKIKIHTKIKTEFNCLKLRVNKEVIVYLPN